MKTGIKQLLVGLNVALIALPINACNEMTGVKPESLVPLAFEIVYEDFSERIRRDDVGDSDLVRHLSDIRNYEITVYEEKAHIMIELLPRMFKGSTLRGGGGKYAVTCEKAEIVGFEAYR